MSDERFAAMISSIAHELRSPLTSVKGFSATLLKRWDRFSDEQRYELVGTINADAERMTRIISAVVDLAKIESGNLKLHKVELNLATLVDEAIEEVALIPGAERVKNLLPGTVTVEADCDRLMHVLRSLVENAVKFSDEGPITITGETLGDEVVLKISDEGVGISAELIHDMFTKPGSRLEEGIPLATGLGLYLSKLILRLHDGDLTAQSTEGERSVFKLSLPIRA